MMRLHAVFGRALTLVLVLSIPWLGGCNGGAMRPDKPAVMERDASPGAAVHPLLPYTLEELHADRKMYREVIDAIANGALQEVPPPKEKVDQLHSLARYYRDVMINRVRADIRSNSGEFEDQLREGVAQWQTAADFVELGLAAATTITGGEQAKTVLAAILTAEKGARISVDKNFFREKTTEAIISALRATRLKQDTLIVEKMTTLGVEKYTFEEAWNDLVDLYYAGTLASGFQTLAEQAGQKAREAEAKKAEVEESRVQLAAATPDELDLARRLYANLRTMTAGRARAILKAAGQDVAPDADAIGELQKRLRGIRPPDRLAKLQVYEKAYNAVLGTGEW